MRDVTEEMPEFRIGRPPLRDWSKIFDGEVHRFGPGDFPGTPSDFGRQARAMAKRFGVRARIITRTRPVPAVWIQRLSRGDG